MKLTVLFFLAACLQVSARSGAQITLVEHQAPLEKVLKEIKRQTGYSVFCDGALLQKAQPVNINVKNLPLKEVLERVFNRQPLSFEIVGDKIITVTEKIPGSSRTDSDMLFLMDIYDVHGKVINEKGEPLAGATVKIKGTTRFIVTRANGEFLFTGIVERSVLIISYVGYEPKEITAAPELGTITLSLAIDKLDEVAVTTAYGIEKRTKELGYSVAKITGEDLNRTNPGNLLSGLTGKVSGLVISNQGVGMNPDNNIILRGIRSINASANNQPLFILNGSPLSFGSDQGSAALAADFINNINPNDIEDVTVLKGANGSALYGPEGVNGVIIITTKKGKKGDMNVNFRASTTFQKIDWNKRKIQEEFGSGELVDDDGNPLYGPTSDMLWGPAYNGEMVPLGHPDENGEVQMVPYKYTTDRQKFWNTAREIRYNLSISQADDHSDFYLGLNHTNQAGLLPGDEQNKTGLLFNTGRQFKRWGVRLNMAYNNTNADKGPPSITTDFIPPHVPLLSYKDYINYKWADRNHYYSDQSANPYEAVANSRKKSGENSLTGNLEFKIKPLYWLTVTERPGITFDAFYSKLTSKPLDYSDYAKELGMNGRWISYEDRKGNLMETTVNMLTINNDLLLSTVHKAGKFSIKTNFGNTVRQSYIKDLRGGASRLAIPVYNLQFGERNETYPNERSELSRFYSFFGTALVGFQDKVFVEITGRNDWDSKLAVGARNKNFYSGINTSIVLNELFPSLQKMKLFNTARLRAAVTKTANMNIKPYQAERLLQSMGFIGEQVGYSYMQNIPNANIQPEHVLSQEYGGHFTLFKNKLDIDIAYYYQRNNGLILDVINSRFSGAPTTDNAGVYDNWGWEFDVNSSELFKTPGGFTAGAGVRLAINDNKVVSLPPVYNDKLNAYAGNVNVIARTGSHAFEYNLTDWKRDEQGRIIVDQFTGIPQLDYENPVYVGRTLPRYTASANINLQYKGISFSVLAEYRGGNEQYNEIGAQGTQLGRSLLTTYNNRQPFVVPNSVYNDGTDKYVPNTDIKVSSIQDYYMEARWVSTNFLVNAGFLTLRELTLSYDFNIKSGTKIRNSINKITVGAYARDLFNIYAKNNIYGDPTLVKGPGSERDKGLPQYDPDANQSNFGSASANYDRVPGTVQYGFVVNVGF